MKVLYFFGAGFDKPNPSRHLMEAMVEDTLKAGIDVHVISSHTTGQDADMPEKFLDHPNFSYNIVKRKNVERHSFVKRYLNGIKYAGACRRPLKRVSDYDIVYIQSSPTALYNILLARWYARKKPIIYSIQDMFPGSSIHSGVMNAKWMQFVFYSLQKIAYRKADYLTVISSDMKQRVMEQGVPEQKIHVLVNWYDDGTVQEVSWEENRFVKKYNLSKDKFYVQYAGTMGYVFDFEMVLKVADLLRGYEDIEFQMIGEGSQKEKFLREKEKQGLDNITFFPLEPQQMVSDVYSACSVCLIPLKKGIIGNSVPSKAPLVMACNRTIINSVDCLSDYYQMFNGEQIGVAVSNDEPRAVAEAILSLYKDEKERIRLAKNAQRYSSAHFSRSKTTKKLINLFHSVRHKKQSV